MWKSKNMYWILNITPTLIGKETAGIQLRIFLPNWEDNKDNKFTFFNLFSSLHEFCCCCSRCFPFNEFVVHIFKYIHTYIMQKRENLCHQVFGGLLVRLIETQKLKTVEHLRHFRSRWSHNERLLYKHNMNNE